MPLVVQGEDDDSSGITCISDVLANNDSLTIRRVNSCEQGSANCADVAGAPYFQASLCSNSSELLSLDYHDWFRLDTTATNLNRTKRDCSTAASKRRFLVHIYFQVKDDTQGDGITTHKREDHGAAAVRLVQLVASVNDRQSGALG